MTIESNAGERTQTATDPDRQPPPSSDPTQRRMTRPKNAWATRLSFGRIGTVYLWVVAVVVFSAWKPDIFPKYVTVTSILNTSAVSGCLALALVIPLAAGVFDLSVGYTLGTGCVITAQMLAHGQSVTTTTLAVVGASLLIGLVNAVVVVIFKIDSFIATLAVGSLLEALILIVSNNSQISNNVDKLTSALSPSIREITLPVFVFAGLAIVLWFVLEKTVTGRHIYATGLGREQARLAGIRTERLRFASFLVSALIAGGAGLMLTGIVGGGSPDIGPPYLIPAFAAVFLGATQLKDGLFNAAGTVLAVLLLGTLNEGIALATSAIWAPYVFNGAVLIAALGLKVAESRREARRAAQERSVAAST